MVLVEAPIRSRSSHRPVQVPQLSGRPGPPPHPQPQGQENPGPEQGQRHTPRNPNGRRGTRGGAGVTPL